MRNLSNEFKQALANDDRNYLVFADITLSDNTVLNLTNQQIWSGGFSTEEAVSDDNAFTALGSTIIGSASLTLDNTGDAYSQYAFENARVVLYIGKEFVGRTTRLEKIKLGTYTVDEATYSDSLISLSLLDSMEQFDRPYTTTLAYPATLDAIVRDACLKCGVTLATYDFPHKSFVVTTKPDTDGATYREVIGWAAAIAGCFAKCNADGQLELKWFDRQALEAQSANVHSISGLYSQDIAVDDTVITGVNIVVQTDDYDEEAPHYLVGTEGYVIEMADNEFITSLADAQTIATWLGTQLIGLTFRRSDVTHLDNPAIEAGDVGIITDRRGRNYPVLITRTNLDVGSTQTTVCGSETPLKNSATRFTSATKSLVKSRKLLRKEATAREQQYNNLEHALDEHSGLYSSVEHTSSGDIYYFHDLPELSESTIIWKMTKEAWGVSTDGGQTWNAGMTVDGDTIVRILTATGINADWIDAGSLIVRDENGNIIFNASNDTHSVFMSSNVQIGGGQSLNSALVGATTSANQYTDEQLGQYSDYVSDKFDEIEGKLDGQVDTWYYDYDPTLNNVPASNWTTETERQNHQGDVFTNTDTGISYRFVYEDGAWKWKVITDTIATQALQNAARAQDTADNKRRVFYTQPTPPYDPGDLWVQGVNGDILRCAVQKASGTSYSETDWVLASKYTDDSAFNYFIDNDYNQTIQSLQEQLDGKAETWYQADDPSLEWLATGVPWLDHNGDAFLDHELEKIYTFYPEELLRHEGDLWHRTTDNKEFIFQNGVWVEMDVPDEVFDKIDGKAQIFGVQPTTPYNVGDLWFTGNEIKYCQTQRLTGEFNSADWVKKDYYTDDSALTAWIAGDFADTVEQLQAQADQKAETWYQATDPSVNWTTPEIQALHTGDLWYNSADGEHTTWFWTGSVWVQQNVPTAVFDEIDGKAQIFVNQPTTPYNIGDLWFDSATADIMTCITARYTGDYVATDWQKRNKYTDDASLNEFVNVVYKNQIELFQQQLDGKVETWYQDDDPSEDWSATSIENWLDHTGADILDHNDEAIQLLYDFNRIAHEGDLWHRTTDNTEWIFKNGEWQPMDIPDDVFDMVDGKAQIFTVQPTTPYNQDDLWFTGEEILVSTMTRRSGDFVESDWVKKDYYTDDTALTTWIAGDYADTVRELQEQADRKAETWYQSTDPSVDWTTETLKALHKGDLWYNTTPTDNSTYYWDGSAWQKQDVPKAVFDEIDGKAQIFVSQPTTPYNVGDLWFNSATSDIMTCVIGRPTGPYLAADWEKRNKYTDDTLAKKKCRTFIAQPTPPYDVGDLWVQGANGDVLRCVVARESGYYTEADWERASKYTDDSIFTAWKAGEYQTTLGNFQSQLDGKIETWYQATAPGVAWTADEKRQHVGDIWYDTTNKLTKQYTVSGNTYSWTTLTDSQATSAMELAQSKRKVFTAQPTVPYDVGDLWWTSTTNGQAVIKVAKTAKTSGNFSQSDWIEPKYTDDSTFETWRDETYSVTIQGFQNQIDGKIETWNQTTNPASNWTTSTEREKHTGDIWYNPDAKITQRYDGSTWTTLQDIVAQNAAELATIKRRVFTSQPTVPYDIGDLWWTSTESGQASIKIAKTFRTSSGTFSQSDWIEPRYTDDSAFNSWKTGVYDVTMASFQEQLDGKIETWYQANNPADSWTTTALKKQHLGDIWYDTANSLTKQYNLSPNNSYRWSILTDADAEAAMTLAMAKRRVFTTTPTVPYDKGDLWWTSTTTGQAVIKMATVSRTSGSYQAGDWVEPKYIDIAQVQAEVNNYDESLNQLAVFNKLTNNSADQGIYLYNNKVYINGEYIKSASIDAAQIKAGAITANKIRISDFSTVKNSDNETTTLAGWKLTSTRISNGTDTYQVYLQATANPGDTTNALSVQQYINGSWRPKVSIQYGGSLVMLSHYTNGNKRDRMAFDASGFSLISYASNGTTVQNKATFDSSGFKTTGIVQFAGTSGNGFRIDSDGVMLTSGMHSGGTAVVGAKPGTEEISDGQGYLYYEGSSSKRYKNHVGDVTKEQAEAILDIPVINFIYKDGYLAEDDELCGKPMPGFYAEDIEKLIPEAVYHNGDGQVENWNARILIPLLLKMTQEQQKEINELKEELKELKEAITLITKKLDIVL